MATRRAVGGKRGGPDVREEAVGAVERRNVALPSDDLGARRVTPLSGPVNGCKD